MRGVVNVSSPALEREKAKLQYALPKEEIDHRYSHSAKSLNGHYHVETSTFFTGKDFLLSAGMILFLMVAIFWLINARSSVDAKRQELQNVQRETQALKTEKGNLQQEVNELSSYERVMQYAKDNGLKLEEENIRNVTNETSK
nr:cell division protein FtsL [Aerococcus urinae]